VARPIAKDHREKRSAILKQAAVYFAEHGYDRASVNGVAGALRHLQVTDLSLL
jgi:AcrR family transcriptional regulator